MSHSSRLDRRAGIAIAILIAAAILANMDRFAEGAAGPLRAHDVADYTVTGLQACGGFWRSALQSTWDPGQMRGWPMSVSAYHPQLIMCMAAGAVPPATIMPIFLTLQLVVMTAGTFLFVRFFLTRSHEVAVAGALIQIGLYYFFHEHPNVPSAILLPALAGFLAVPGRSPASRVLMTAGAAVVMGLSTPPGTLILMPIGHACLILAAPRAERRGHLIRGLAYWCVYGLYYAPTMIAQLSAYAQSSRALYRPNPAAVAFVTNLKEMLLNPAVLSPAAVFVMLIGRRSSWRTVVFLVAVVTGVALCALNQVLLASELGRRFPVLVAISSTYYRLYYFVPVTMLIWAVWLIERHESRGLWNRVARTAAMGAFCYAASRYFADASDVVQPYWKYAAVAAAVTGLGATWWTRRAWTTVLVAVSVTVFFRYEYRVIWETPSQGNLFVEPAHMGVAPTLSRTVTVMFTCEADDIFAAQAAVAGEETLDGISNFYARSFAERWRYFVSDNPALCTGRYSRWGTRVELTADDLKLSSDRILPWLWINNVRYLRSTAPLGDPDLRLVDQRGYTVNRTTAVTRYLYEIGSPVTRIFSMPEPLAERAAAGDFAAEDAALQQLALHGGVTNVDTQAVSGSHLRVSGAFPPGRRMVASVNSQRGWRLLVDGKPSAAALTAGPFGMVSFHPVPGTHTYDLEFHSRETPFVPACMLIALGFLWVASGYPRLDRRSEVRAGAGARPASRRRFAVVAAMAGVSAVAAIVIRRRLTEGPQPVWIDAPYRAALHTEGARQTETLTNFPVRVECTPQDADFWKGVHSSGADIRFADTQGDLLPFEMETFDYARQHLAAWVKIPSLLPGPHDVGYLYYGNERAPKPTVSESAWDASYARISHGLFSGQHESTDALDSPGIFTNTGEWSVEFWVNPAPQNGRSFELISEGTPVHFNLYLHSEGFMVLERPGAARPADISLSRETIRASVWTAVTLTRTRRHLRIAINGQLRSTYMATPDIAPTGGPAGLALGRGPYHPLDGSMKEVRISRSARSADWILASFRAQSPEFVTKGRTETAPRT